MTTPSEVKKTEQSWPIGGKKERDGDQAGGKPQAKASQHVFFM